MNHDLKMTFLSSSFLAFAFFLATMVNAETWYDTNYPYRYFINETTTSAYSMSINGTNKIFGLDIVWALMNNDSYIYCKVSNCANGQYIIANETELKNYENETHRLGNNPTSVYLSAGSVWHFQNNAYDSSGNSNTLTLSSTSYVDFMFGKGLENSATSYAYTAKNSKLNFTKPTVMAWANFSKNNQYNTIVDNTNPGGFWMGVSNDNHIRCVYQDGASHSVEVKGSSTLTVNTLYFLACVQNATGVVAYKNGVVDGYGAFAYNVLCSTAGECSLCLGTNADNGANCGDSGLNFEGRLDEVRVYDRTLSTTEILAIYDNGLNTVTTFGGEEYHCEANFTLYSTDDVCYNETNYEHNTTYHDENTCDVGNLWIINYTYPVLDYEYVSNSTDCYNETNMNTTWVYGDVLDCAYSITNYTYPTLTYHAYSTENNCYNETNYEHNVTTVNTTCDYFSSTLTYPELVYGYNHSIYLCYNTTALNTTDIFTDELSCGYFTSNDSLSTCPFSCVANSCLTLNGTSKKYCLNNNTLIKETAVYTNGTFSSSIEVVNCANGCSETFNLCMPSNFIIGLIVLAGFVIVVGIIKFIRR